MNEGLCQADIARKLKFSRAYINQTVKRLEGRDYSNGLTRTKPHRENGSIIFSILYQMNLNSVSRVSVQRNPLPLVRVHNLRKKFTWHSSSPVSTDARAGWTKSWEMRGPTRHKFWYEGKAGIPSVTIDVHPRTLVVYIDARQFIPAQTPDEAKEIGWKAVYAAVDSFVAAQKRFGIEVRYRRPGRLSGNRTEGLSVQIHRL